MGELGPQMGESSIIPTSVKALAYGAATLAVAKFFQPSVELAAQHYREYREDTTSS